MRYYVEVSGTRKALKAMVDGMITTAQTQLKQDLPSNPDAIVQFGSILREEVPSIDNMIDLLLPIYQKHFTVAELQELNKFYSTPVMREMVRSTPLVMQEAAPVEIQVIQRSQARLQERLQKWINSLKHAGGNTSDSQ